MKKALVTGIKGQSRSMWLQGNNDIFTTNPAYHGFSVWDAKIAFAAVSWAWRQFTNQRRATV
jgi:hypothetical protein